MYREHKIIALILARGGSKGIPDKNIVNLAGKPLIQWTIESAKKSKYIDAALVSTDSEKIKKISKDAGADVPFLRPEELATDTSSSVDAILHALNFLKTNNIHYDYFVVLQPTSPLRTSNNIDEAIEKYFKLKQSSDETLISVVRLPQKYGWLLSSRDGTHLNFCLSKNGDVPLRRQDLGTYYLPNGAIYLSSVNDFKETFYNGKALYYEMSEEQSVDIDNLSDLDLAEKILLKGIYDGN